MIVLLQLFSRAGTAMDRTALLRLVTPGGLSISHQVAWTNIGAAVTRTPGLWNALYGLRGGCAGRQDTPGNGRCQHVTT
jgi:hypothetical protein